MSSSLDEAIEGGAMTAPVSMTPVLSRHSRVGLALAVGVIAAGVLALQFVASREGVGLLLLGLALLLVSLMLAFGRAASGGLLAVSLLASLALAEFLVPWLLGAPEQQVRVLDAPHYWGRGDLGARPNEGRFRTLKSLSDGTPIYDVVYSIGPDHQRITPGDAGRSSRVNFMGCSVTYGEGLQDHETLPAYFVQQLEGVQARNFAFHGYGPQQALAVLQSPRDTQGQVNVFVTAPWHALRSACKPIWTIGSPRYRLADGGELRRDGACGDILQPWLPASLTRQLARSAVFVAVRDQVMGGVSDGDIELYLAIVQAMTRVSHERGQRQVVGFIKADEVFFQGTRFSNASVLAELRKRADEVIDLTLSPRAEDIPRPHYLHALDRHPSAEANLERARILAAVIAPLLKSASVAPPAGRP
jgi:hypothetical protein